MKSGGCTDWNRPWNSLLRMDASGHLAQVNGALINRGSYDDFWSSTQYFSTYGWYLAYWNSTNGCNMYNYYKSYGFSLRCFRNN